MKDRRPAQILGTIVAVGALSVLGSAVLDKGADWGDPQQAAANVLWIVFLLSALALIVVGITMLSRKGRSDG